MKTFIVFGVLLIAVVYVSAVDNLATGPEFVIPKPLEEEGMKLKEKIDALHLPKTADGKYPDICKITDEGVKKAVYDFIDKVNAAGGKMPKPHC